MKKIEKDNLTREIIEKAMQCQTADELMKLAESEGYELTKEAAERFLEEHGDVELTDEDMKRVAGGQIILWDR